MITWLTFETWLSTYLSMEWNPEYRSPLKRIVALSISTAFIIRFVILTAWAHFNSTKKWRDVLNHVDKICCQLLVQVHHHNPQFLTASTNFDYIWITFLDVLQPLNPNDWPVNVFSCCCFILDFVFHGSLFPQNKIHWKKKKNLNLYFFSCNSEKKRCKL